MSPPPPNYLYIKLVKRRRKIQEKKTKEGIGKDRLKTVFSYPSPQHHHPEPSLLNLTQPSHPRKSLLLPPPLLEPDHPLTPLPHELPPHFGLGHPLQPQELLVHMVDRVLQRAGRLGAPEGEHARQPHGPDGVQPVGVLDDGELRIGLDEISNAGRVLDLAAVRDAQTDGLDLGGEDFVAPLGEEDGLDLGCWVCAWLDVSIWGVSVHSLYVSEYGVCVCVCELTCDHQHRGGGQRGG